MKIYLLQQSETRLAGADGIRGLNPVGRKYPAVAYVLYHGALSDGLDQPFHAVDCPR